MFVHVIHGQSLDKPVALVQLPLEQPRQQVQAHKLTVVDDFSFRKTPGNKKETSSAQLSQSSKKLSLDILKNKVNLAGIGSEKLSCKI